MLIIEPSSSNWSAAAVGTVAGAVVVLFPPTTAGALTLMVVAATVVSVVIVVSVRTTGVVRVTVTSLYVSGGPTSARALRCGCVPEVVKEEPEPEGALELEPELGGGDAGPGPRTTVALPKDAAAEVNEPAAEPAAAVIELPAAAAADEAVLPAPTAADVTAPAADPAAEVTAPAADVIAPPAATAPDVIAPPAATAPDVMAPPAFVKVWPTLGRVTTPAPEGQVGSTMLVVCVPMVRTIPVEPWAAAEVARARTFRAV
jgi:hypothetical protein